MYIYRCICVYLYEFSEKRALGLYSNGEQLVLEDPDPTMSAEPQGSLSEFLNLTMFP